MGLDRHARGRQPVERRQRRLQRALHGADEHELGVEVAGQAGLQGGAQLLALVEAELREAGVGDGEVMWAV